MMLATVEVIPLTIVVSRLPDEVATFELMIVVVATTPLVVLVRVLLVEVRVLEVEEATKLASETVVVTPFTLDIKLVPLAIRELRCTSDPLVVATTPLTVDTRVKLLVEVEIVKVLLVELATKFLRSVEVATPLTVVVRVVPEVEIPLVVLEATS